MARSAPPSSAGDLVLSLGSARWRVSGELAIATLDVRPFLDATPDRPEKQLTYTELTQQTLPLRRPSCRSMADLVLQLGSSLGLPVEVRDARVALHADERGLRAPIAANDRGRAAHGPHRPRHRGADSRVRARAGHKNLPLSGLGQDASGVDGKLDSVALRLGGRGETLGALIADLDARLTVAGGRLRYGSGTGRRPVELTVDAAEVVAARGQRVHGRLRGTLLGERATLAFRAGELPQMLREPVTPIELELTAAGADRPRRGHARAPRRGTRAAISRFGSMRGAPATSHAGWASRRSPIWRPRCVVACTSTTSGVSRTLRSSSAAVELTVDAHRASDGGKPIIVAAVRSPLIDVPELRTLRRKSTDAPPARSGRGWTCRSCRRASTSPAPTSDSAWLESYSVAPSSPNVGVGAHIRDGRLLPSPYAARFAGVSFEGLAGFDLRGEVPEVSLSMSTGSVDVGMLLRTLGVAEDIDARADALQVKLLGRGSALRELLDHSTFEMRLQGGDLTVRGPARRAVAEIRLEQALVTALPGKPITVRLQGALDDTPAELTVSSGTLDDFVRDASRVPLSVEAKAAGPRLALEGKVALPLGAAARSRSRWPASNWTPSTPWSAPSCRRGDRGRSKVPST